MSSYLESVSRCATWLRNQGVRDINCDTKVEGIAKMLVEEHERAVADLRSCNDWHEPDNHLC